MRIHDTKLAYEIENQPVLIQKRVCNVCRVYYGTKQNARNAKNHYLYLLHIFNQMHFKNLTIFGS